jgi:hypothetical protein
MNILTWVGSILLFANLLQASVAGFSTGSKFEVEHLSGELSIYCPGSNPTFNRINCEADVLAPTEFDYFIGPNIVGATIVQLNNPAMGSRVHKSSYNSTSGKSKKEFNLWIRTLLQRPLLNEGPNTVNYILMNDDKVVLEQGEFKVQVSDGASRTCPDGQYVSNLPDDCEFSQGYTHCMGYFRQYNYCK